MSNAAVTVLAAALAGISEANRNVDSDAPDLAADYFDPIGEHGVAAAIELPAGDRYRITVEWLRDESP